MQQCSWIVPEEIKKAANRAVKENTQMPEVKTTGLCYIDYFLVIKKD